MVVVFIRRLPSDTLFPKTKTLRNRNIKQLYKTTSKDNLQ